MPSRPNVNQIVEHARPLVNRLAEDEELRESLKSAFSSAQRVYAGINDAPSRRGAAVRLVGDPDLRDELQQAITELRRASDRARRPPPRSRGKVFFVIGAVAAFVVLNPVTGPPLREKLASLFSGRSAPELDYGD